ncbi:MAG: helix-turn-helix transcriptional regulator [Gemmatimonadetes bacterium]|nr:helix-turn-helix transcriptional regulator [Gemmatimonadota bacterium]
MSLFKKKEHLPEDAQLLEIETRHNLAQQVFFRREASEWSQEELAKRAQMTQAQVATVEAGQANPTLRTVVKLAHALRCSVTGLFASHERDRKEEESSVFPLDDWETVPELHSSFLEATAGRTTYTFFIHRQERTEGELTWAPNIWSWSRLPWALSPARARLARRTGFPARAPERSSKEETLA